MNRPDSLDTSDIAGAQTKRQLSRERTQHPFNSSADIEFSRPQARGLQTNRCTDSLNPVYQLPSFTPPAGVSSSSAPRDVLWTIPKQDRRLDTRPIMDWSDVESRSTDLLLRKSLMTRDIMSAGDINVSQFRMDAPSTRSTNPLLPEYVYDGGAVDQVVTRVPKYGRRYPRPDESWYPLKCKDVNGEPKTGGAGVGATSNPSYPLHLIKTRPSNRTDDVYGATVNSIGWRSPLETNLGPKVWKDTSKEMSAVPEKLTNKVFDISGTAPGTGGCSAFGPPPMYRVAKQTAMVEAMTAHAAKARQADIDAVRALS